MMRTLGIIVIVLAGLFFAGEALLRATPNTDISQQPDTRATFSTEELESESDLIPEYGSLTKTYVDADHVFSLQYPASFIEGNFPGWDSIVDNNTKARIWLGFCSPDCVHLVRSPFVGSEAIYTKDHTVTSEDSPTIPAGEGRRIHVLSNHEFTTAHGTHAIEQFYEVTGFDVATGEPVTLYCVEDTPCKAPRPALRYIFFSDDKDPYVVAVRAPVLNQQSDLSLIRSIIDTAAY